MKGKGTPFETWAEQSAFDPSDVRSLDVLEETLSAALNEQFVSASVIRDTARLKLRTSFPLTSVKMLSRTQPLMPVRAACYELERRGLAERSEVAGVARWRMAGAYRFINSPK